MCGVSSGVSTLFHYYPLFLLQNQTALFQIPVIWLKIWNCDLSGLSFIVQDNLGHLWSLVFPFEFLYLFFLTLKNLNILIRIGFTLYITISDMNILMILTAYPQTGYISPLLNLLSIFSVFCYYPYRGLPHLQLGLFKDIYLSTSLLL